MRKNQYTSLFFNNARFEGGVKVRYYFKRKAFVAPGTSGVYAKLVRVDIQTTATDLFDFDPHTKGIFSVENVKMAAITQICHNDAAGFPEGEIFYVKFLIDGGIDFDENSMFSPSIPLSMN